jgi:putative ABC transport system permease protein
MPVTSVRVAIDGFVEGVRRDVRHAARSLRRVPGFAIGMLATLLLGTSALVAMFGIVDRVMLRPLPYREPARLVGVWYDMHPVNLLHEPQSVQTYFTIRTQAHSVADIGLYRATAANVGIPGASADPERLEIAGCTASLFHVLGVPARLGRAFTSEEDQRGAPPVVVISEAFWRTRLGADPLVLGRRLDVNGVQRAIVGVASESLALPTVRTALWIPLALDPANPPASAFSYTAVARLSPGVTPAEAERDIATVLPRAAELYPQFVPGITMRQILDQTKPIPVVTSLQADITGDVSSKLWLMAAAALLVFVVSCVNAGNLALVRFDARRHELAVREALGATNANTARAFVAEVVVVGVIACAGAIAVASVALQLLRHTSVVDVPRLSGVGLDARAVVFAAIVATSAIVVCCLTPMIRIRRGLAIDRAARSSTASRRENRLRGALVSAQVALALVALASAGVLIRSSAHLRAVDPGFDPGGLATFWVSLPASRYRTDADVVRFYSDLQDRLGAIEGVMAAGLTSRLPLMTRGNNENPLYPEGSDASNKKLPALQLFSTVAGDYFGALRIPLVAGRVFAPPRVQRDGEAIISRRTAQLFWNDSTGRSAIGKRFRVLPTSNWYTVVGVVGNVHDSTLAHQPAPSVYFPQTESTDPTGSQIARTMAAVIRTARDPSAIDRAARAIVHELDPSLPVFDSRPMTDLVRASTAGLALLSLIIGVAAVITLLLGAIGLYGVMSYVVTLRRSELGIRVALGATPRSLAMATTREAMTVTGAGMAAGFLLFAVAARFVNGMLFGVAPWDPLTIVAAAIGLAATALFASWLPARRASRIDAMRILRGG